MSGPPGTGMSNDRNINGGVMNISGDKLYSDYNWPTRVRYDRIYKGVKPISARSKVNIPGLRCNFRMNAIKKDPCFAIRRMSRYTFSGLVMCMSCHIFDGLPRHI